MPDPSGRRAGAFFAGACVILAPSASLSQGAGLNAHEHGHFELEVALDGARLSLRLEAPAMDVVGFEHPPSTDTERTAIDDALEMLSETSTLFVFPAKAACEAEDAQAELHRDGDHSAFEIAYALTCADPSALT